MLVYIRSGFRNIRLFALILKIYRNPKIRQVFIDWVKMAGKGVTVCMYECKNDKKNF